MKRVRAKFIKGPKVKYISHLDILRTFGRALRRGNVPVAYSKGFNPHPIISFGLPLSVGVTSDGEFVDIDLEEDISQDEFLKRMNSGLPEDLRVLDCHEIDSKANIVTEIYSAKYHVTLSGEEMEKVPEYLKDLLGRQEILVLKETKSGKKEVNIREKIRNIDIIQKTYDKAIVFMELDAGSQSNIKPELVTDALTKYYGIQFADVDAHRLELLL